MDGFEISFYDVFEEALEQYNSNQKSLPWIAEELRIHPTISLEQLKKLPECEDKLKMEFEIFCKKFLEDEL